MIQKTRIIKTFSLSEPSPQAGLFSVSTSKTSVFIADLVFNKHTGYYNLISTTGVKFEHVFESFDDNTAIQESYRFLINEISKEIIEYIYSNVFNGEINELDKTNPLAD